MKKKHKRYLYIGLIVVLDIIIICLIIRALRNGSRTKGNIIAYIDRKPVYRSEVQDRINSFMTGADVKKDVKLEDFPESFIKAMVLEVAVNNKIDALARKEGIHKNKEVRKMVEDYQKRLVREKFIEEKVISNIDEGLIARKYNELTGNLQGKEERKVKHILVRDFDEAQRVRRNIMRTGNFESIAAQKSIDTSTAEKGGDLGYILKEEMVPEFGDAAFLLKKGVLSKPVQTQFGWHIIKVEDIREATPLPFGQVRARLKTRLQQEALQDYLKRMTEGMEVNLKIESKTQNQQIETEEEQGAGEEGSEVMEDEIEIEDIETKEVEEENSESKE